MLIKMLTFKIKDDKVIHVVIFRLFYIVLLQII